jgi:hypothetical protein
MSSARLITGILFLLGFLVGFGQSVKEKTRDVIKEEVFSLEAVYSGSECDGQLVSFEFHHAFFPLTWHELNEKNEIVQSTKDLPLESLKDQTTYVVEDARQYTDTVFVQHNISSRINNLFPNPTNGEIFLDIESTIEETIEVKLIETSGRIISSFILIASPESEPFRIDLSNLEKGIYLLNLNSQCIKETLKVLNRGL